MAAKAEAKKVDEKKGDLSDVATMLRGEYTIMGLRLSGDALLVHQWGQKAFLEMLARMGGHPVPQMNKDLSEEGYHSAYRNAKGEDVVPCRVIKACFCNGAAKTKGAVKQHEFTSNVRVLEHTSPLHFEHVDRCDVDLVKVGPWNDRVVDIRARTLYTNWYCDVVLKFPHNVIGASKVIAAVREAGDSAGLCEKRIEKGFGLGGFIIKSLPLEEIEATVQACSSPEARFEIPEYLLHAASAKVEDLDKRNPKKKALAVVKNLATAEQRFAETAAAEAEEEETND